MAYSELIKNFENIRAYMREFYVYGFKSRNEYNIRSARSYDDERRRIESWLGDYMRFVQNADGKKFFLSIDGRAVKHNPLYKIWKVKSFTDGDITLHFLLFDILYNAYIKKTLGEIISEIDSCLAAFDEPMSFDESTIRKKLKEYVEKGIICTEKVGRRVLFSRTGDFELSEIADVLDFFSETMPCGVIGSFLCDRTEQSDSIFSFKHHYITQAIDSDVMAEIFDAMQRKSYVTADNFFRHSNCVKTISVIPLKIYISSQNGRSNLIAYNEKNKQFISCRLDYMSNIRIGERCKCFDELRAELSVYEKNIWGVSGKINIKHTEHVEFDVCFSDNERYIISRLEREKRCGRVEIISDSCCRYSADVCDVNEMLPWIRTFISRIVRISFSNAAVEQRFKADLENMYCMYGLEGAGEL